MVFSPDNFFYIDETQPARISDKKEFEKVKKERSFFENKCEQLQKKLKSTQEQEAAIKKQYQELKHFKLNEKFQQNEGNYRYIKHGHTFAD